MIRYIVFDMAGVLVTRVHRNVLKELSQRFALDYEKLHRHDKPTWDKVLRGKMTETEMYLKLIEDYKLDISLKEIQELALSFIKPIGETWKLVDDLRGKYNLVVLSDMGIEWAQQREKFFELHGSFSKVFWSHEVGLIKTDKEMFDYLLKKLEAEPSECILIDDREENCVTARQKGLKAIVFHNTLQVRNKLHDLGVAV